jgi:UPF0271 protein
MADDSKRAIDLNSDLGESFGAYQIGDDAGLFGLISSANVACGFHGGDPRVMEQTVTAANEHGIGVGAHPGFPDLVGFGRRDLHATPDEVRTDTLYQLGALDAFCRAVGLRMQHVKAHGALDTVATRDVAIAEAIVAAVRAYDPTLIVLCRPGSHLANAAAAVGLLVAREGFADRAYEADGNLVSRRKPGAMVTDPAVAAARMRRLVAEGKLATIDGQDLALEVDSICVHADTPGAATIVRAVREALKADGVAIRPLREIVPSR